MALDIDGVVAGRYAATAIPQTVIIDCNGQVACLFAGGDSDLADQLRASLREIVGGELPEETKSVPPSKNEHHNN